MDDWAWHDVLYALWCLGDVERVEELEARIERVSLASMTPISQGGVKNLNSERQAVMAEIRKQRNQGDEMPVAVLLTFPGFPHYKGPVS